MLIATAPGLRDQRVRVYRPVVTNVDGFLSTSYWFVGEYWSRIQIATSRESVAGDPQQHLDFRTEASALFDSYAVVPQNGLVRWRDEVYFVRGVVLQRAVEAKTASLELISTDRFRSFVLVETPTAPVADDFPTIDPVPLTPGHST